MPKYRIFQLNDAGQILGRSKTVTYQDDRDAVTEIRKRLNGAMLEVWEGARRVAIIRSNDEMPRA
jgi:hypothetical protein